MHPRNPHQGRYDLKALVGCCPELANYLVLNPRGEQTVNFSNEKAVRLLNQALLAHYYKIAHWDIPQGYLCPPIPGRADYIHYAADLLMGKKDNAQVLDIGTGANCIYPIIGNRSYGWKFVGSDIDPLSVATAKLIVESNPVLKNKIKLTSVVLTGEKGTGKTSIAANLIKNSNFPFAKFISSEDMTGGETTIGQWGGLVILGNAPTNLCNTGDDDASSDAELAACGVSAEGDAGLYGGADAEDDEEGNRPERDRN